MRDDAEQLVARLKAAFADRYTIERELGRGGMATVFLARDLRHDRAVALKVLAPEVASAIGVERFLREIKVAARLQHPHILPLHDSGEADGLLYYVMPYVEGESLRARLEREKQLPLEDALRIAREVAEALSYAHAHDVVHRDIKPENILLSGGKAVVADFGIARAITAASVETLTETGTTVGTPYYTSPEQGAGERQLDGRSDIYSLGCVLYEMLAGHPPFLGATLREVLARHALDPVPPLRAARPTVPEAVEGAITRALAKTAADRFPSAERFADALGTGAEGSVSSVRTKRRKRWIVVGAAVLLLLAVLVGAAVLVPVQTRATIITLLTREPLALEARRIVVAPLANRTGDTTFNVLGQMAADWITRHLMQTGEFDVVDERTAFTTARIVAGIPRMLRDRDVALALARETGAGRVVAGALYLVGDSLRAEVRLTDTESGAVVRALEAVSAARDEPSVLVDRLARRTVAALAIAADSTIISATAAPSYEAYRELAAAWESYLRLDRPGASDYLDRAIAIDSGYPAPWLLRAFIAAEDGWWARADSAVARLEAERDGMTAAEQVFLDALKADLASDHYGYLRAAQELRRLLPSSPEAAFLVAWGALRLNRPRVALEALDRLDPDRGINLFSPVLWAWRARALHELGDHEAELDVVRDGMGRSTTPWMRGFLIPALAALGRITELDEVVAELRAKMDYPRNQSFDVRAVRELRVHGWNSAAEEWASRALSDARGAGDTALAEVQYIHGELLYEAGRWEDARAVFSHLVAQDSLIAVPALGYLGAIAARLGDRDAAHAISEQLAGRPERYAPGWHTFWRAHIAAALGEKDEAVALLRNAFSQGQSYDHRAEPGRWGSRQPTVHGHLDFVDLYSYKPFRDLIGPHP